MGDRSWHNAGGQKSTENPPYSLQSLSNAPHSDGMLAPAFSVECLLLFYYLSKCLMNKLILDWAACTHSSSILLVVFRLHFLQSLVCFI